MTDAAATSAETISAPQPRPYLARWLFEHRKSFREFGALTGVSHQAVSLWCKPFGDPARLKPGHDSAWKITTATGGAVPAWTFDDTPEARMAATYGPAAIRPPADVRP